MPEPRKKRLPTHWVHHQKVYACYVCPHELAKLDSGRRYCAEDVEQRSTRPYATTAPFLPEWCPQLKGRADA